MQRRFLPECLVGSRKILMRVVLSVRLRRGMRLRRRLGEIGCARRASAALSAEARAVGEAAAKA